MKGETKSLHQPPTQMRSCSSSFPSSPSVQRVSTERALQRLFPSSRASRHLPAAVTETIVPAELQRLHSATKQLRLFHPLFVILSVPPVAATAAHVPNHNFLLEPRADWARAVHTPDTPTLKCLLRFLAPVPWPSLHWAIKRFASLFCISTPAHTCTHTHTHTNIP